MASTYSSGGRSGDLLTLSAEINRADTATAAFTRTIELAETAFERPVVSVCEWDPDTGAVSIVQSSGPPSSQASGPPDRIPEPVAERLSDREAGPEAVGTPEATVDADAWGPLETEVLVPVVGDRLLRLGTTNSGGIDESGVRTAEGIAANLETALARVDERASTTEDDLDALRRLNELAVGTEPFEVATERLLSLGCEHFGLDTAILARVDGTDYEVEAVVDATDTHEPGAVYDLGETMCAATLAGEATEPLAFADVSDTAHSAHPAAESVHAYIAAPVVVDGEAYGTVNFSMGRPREAAFRPEEEAFVRLVAQWIGTEIERRRRFEELERYETILEAVDDPVYALDADGRFTFLNGAAERAFGYGEEVLGERPEVGMDESDVERVQEQIAQLLATGERSTTAEFELETADGDRRIVENRLARIGNEAFRGTAGVLRDVSDREQQRRQLKSFQRAVESARDGVAILDGDEYTYVDRTHVEMYGFDDKEQLLGDTWRRLYDDEEVERLEAEAFPALEADGYWRGMVTGSRPDGSTFPAELSLTVVEDGRLVCTVRDESERRERERRTEARRDFLRRIYEVTTDPEMPFEAKLSELLEAGRTHLGLPYGFLTQIETGEESVPCTQTVVEACGTHDRLQPGESVPLSRSYCRKTIEHDGVVALTDASEAGWAGDPAYETFELETYVGSEVVTDDGLYGTLCFAAKDPRERPFDEFERSFVNLVGRWVGYEIDRRNAREELRQQRERLDLTLSGTDTGLAEWDLATDAVTWNETLVDIVGRDVTAIEAFRAAVHPADRDRVQRELEQMLETGEPWTGEFRVVGEDGDTTWLGSRATPVYDGDGTPVRVLATGTDVSDRKRAERERRRNERRFESLFEDPGMLVGLLDTDGTLLEANQTARSYVEATAGALRGEPFWETPWWTDSETPANTVREWVQRAADGEYVEYSATHPGPDGSRRHVTGVIRPVTDESGAVRSLFVSGRDVTERERQQRVLRDRQQKLDLVLSSTDTSVVELDVERETVRWDGKMGDNSIGSPETLDALLETVHPDDRERLRSDLERMAATGEPLNSDYRLVDEDGDLVWVATQAASAAEVDEDSAGKIVAIATNITELKRREEALVASQDRYQTLLQAAPDPVFVADAETGELIEANTAAESILGRPREEIVGRDQTELHPQPDAALYGEAFDRSTEGSGMISELPDGTQPKLRTADGETVPVEINADTVQLQERTVMYGVFRDISDRREREASLRASERRYRHLAENIPNGAVLTFDDELTYRLAAGELLSEMGLEPSDITGMAAGKVLSGSEVDDELPPRFRAALDGERTDCRIETDDRILRTHIVPIDHDGESSEAHGLVLAQDVTDDARRERELYAERERFRQLIESVDEYAFLVVDEDGAIETWNDGAAAMFGYDAETAVGMSLGELHPAADREAGVPERLLQQARVAGESAHEGRRVRADGSAFYADVRHALLEADDGTFRGYAAIVRDMTDRRHRRRRTEQFVNESEDVVTIVDTDGTVTYASGSADRVLGHDPDDLVGENLFDYIHPDGREDAMELFYADVETPDADFQTECRFASGDGEWLNVEGRCRNMLDEDAIDGMLLYLRDVTDAKRRARRFESIFNQTFQFTGLLEPDGTVVEVNDAALAFGGVDREEIVGEAFFDASWWTHAEAVRDDVRDAIRRAAAGEFVRYQTEVRGADGLATIDFSAKPVTDEDDEVSLLVVEGRDVTAQQQHRQHLEVMQRVMRHNMRNDLTKVRGWTEMMCEETDPDRRCEQFETVEEILDKWRSMTETMGEIRQVLQFQKKADRRVDPQSLLEDAAATVREAAPDATVTVDATDAGPARIPSTVSAAVRELLENATAASEDATVEAGVATPEDGWVEVSVRDDGPGLPEMEADVLETGEETPLNHGKGLGLWMVRMIITQAGGEVSVETTADGTTVTLRLPADRRDETELPVETAG